MNSLQRSKITDNLGFILIVKTNWVKNLFFSYEPSILKPQGPVGESMGRNFWKICKVHVYSDESEILGIKHSDYQYRMKITKNDWTDYLSNCAHDIDYANVKDNIPSVGDDLHQDTYYQVWIALYRWQSKMSDA